VYRGNRLGGEEKAGAKIGVMERSCAAVASPAQRSRPRPASPGCRGMQCGDGASGEGAAAVQGSGVSILGGCIETQHHRSPRGRPSLEVGACGAPGGGSHLRWRLIPEYDLTD
jgi:hypothetical protein